MPEIKRSSTFDVYDGSDSSKAICHKCEEKGLEVFLVPYLMKDGRPDTKFRRCPNCSAIIEKRKTKFQSEVKPLGSVSGIGNANFKSVNPRRRTRDRNDFDDPRDYIPKLAGKPDTDVLQMIEDGAIVVSISDTNIEEE